MIITLSIQASLPLIVNNIEIANNSSLELVKQSGLVNKFDKSHYLSENVKIFATILLGKVSIHKLI